MATDKDVSTTEAAAEQYRTISGIGKVSHIDKPAGQKNVDATAEALSEETTPEEPKTAKKTAAKK
jgi:hypothetical protein